MKCPFILRLLGVLVFVPGSVVLAGQEFCPISLSRDTLDFGRLSVNDDHRITLTLKNLSQSKISLPIIDIASVRDVFTFQGTSRQVLEPQEEAILTFGFRTTQNISYSGMALIRINCPDQANYSLPVLLKAAGEYTDTTYRFIQDLEGQKLYNTLSTWLQGQTVYSYADARSYMFSRVDNVNGTVECVYTGRKIQTTTIPNPNDFNTEHTWPQSKGSDKEPARTDIYHLYPTDSKANEKRSNNPYGVVTRQIMWEQNGSKLGLPTGSSDTTFEPRNVHKGNVARSMFYYCVRYGNRKGQFDSQGFLTGMENILRDWNKSDPVDERELLRNESIATLQKRRNPFIDHPSLIERFYRLSTQPDFPLYPEPVCDQRGYSKSVNPGDSAEFTIPVFNKGNQQARITAVEFRPATESARILSVSDSIVQPGNMAMIKLRIFSSLPDLTQMRIRFADGVSTVAVPISASVAISSVQQEMEAAARIEMEIFPNPALHGDLQQLHIQLPAWHNPAQAQLKVYSVQGQEIADFSSAISWNGLNGSVNLQNLPAHAVFCRIISMGSTASAFVINGTIHE
jgi:endonuclease I